MHIKGLLNKLLKRTRTKPFSSLKILFFLKNVHNKQVTQCVTAKSIFQTKIQQWQLRNEGHRKAKMSGLRHPTFIEKQCLLCDDAKLLQNFKFYTLNS